MNADAQTLISLLEKECRSLRRMIAEAVREEEFNVAAAHQRALDRTLARIYIIQRLEDRNFRRKEFLRNMINRWQDRDFHDLPWHRETKSELAELDQQGPVPVPVSKILESKLNLIVSGALKGINIVISPTAGLVINVRRKKGDVIVHFPRLRKLLNNDVIAKRQLRKLRAFGFEQVSEDRMQMTFSRGEDTLARMMIVFSRIVFDVLQYNEFKGQSYIEVVE
jgi:hypothetical protein